MDDYIKRSDAKDMVHLYAITVDKTGTLSSVLRNIIRDISPADVRSVVLCRDCRYYKKFREGEGDAFYGWCDTHNICVRNYFFCADGERREGGTP